MSADKITPKQKTLPAIGIRRIDSITFEVYSVQDGQQTSILKETFGIVQGKANDILQQMAEGSYRG